MYHCVSHYHSELRLEMFNFYRHIVEINYEERRTLLYIFKLLKKKKHFMHISRKKTKKNL